MNVDIGWLIGIVVSSNVISVLVMKLMEKKRTKSETDKNQAETERIHIDNAINFDRYKDKQIKDLNQRVDMLEANLKVERENCDKKMKAMQEEIDNLKITARSYETQNSNKV